jgi:hypothetical protein
LLEFEPPRHMDERTIIAREGAPGLHAA